MNTLHGVTLARIKAPQLISCLKTDRLSLEPKVELETSDWPKWMASVHVCVHKVTFWSVWLNCDTLIVVNRLSRLHDWWFMSSTDSVHCVCDTVSWRGKRWPALARRYTTSSNPTRNLIEMVCLHDGILSKTHSGRRHLTGEQISVSVLVCDAASKTFPVSMFFRLLVDRRDEWKRAGWSRCEVISTEVSFFSFQFFLKRTKTKHPLAGMRAQTQSEFCLPSLLFYFFLFHHSHFDWQFTGGETVSRQDKALLLFARQGTLEKKGIVGEKGARFRHHRHWEGGSRLFMLLLHVFTSQPHVRLGEP